MNEKRDEIRGKLFASAPKRRSEVVTLDVNGAPVEVEVRAPTLAADAKIAAAGRKLTFNPNGASSVEVLPLELQVAAMLECCFVPGTDVKVFDRADADAIRGAEKGSWLEKLGERAVAIRTPPAAEVVEADFQKAPSST